MTTTAGAPVVGHRLKFRAAVFDNIAEQFGLVTDAAKARFLGIDQSQYTRAKNNTVEPSQVFIKHVLMALPQVTFEKLFEIVEVVAK